VAIFLIALTLVLVSDPFTESLPLGDLIEAGRVTLLMLVALLASGGNRRTLLWGVALVTPALLAKWANHFRPDLIPAWTFTSVGILFLIYVLRQLLRFVIRAPRVDSEVLCGGVAIYLMLGLLWTFAYVLIARLNPNAFAFTAGGVPGQSMKGSTAIYFSFITLSTVGYGDIVPLSGAARMLAISEATVGILYTTILVARLVTLYTSPTPTPETSERINP
jgi:hypothetical protein